MPHAPYPDQPPSRRVCSSYNIEDIICQSRSLKMPRPRRTKVATNKNKKNDVIQSSTPEDFRMSGALAIETPKKNSIRITRTKKTARSNEQKQNTIQKSPKSTLQSRQLHQTPEPVVSDDLYGLSPSGEASRLRIEAQKSAQRSQPVQLQSTIKAFSTPSVETSVLALKKFKKRKRQSSIIRMMHEASEIGHTTGVDSLQDLDNLDGMDDFDLSLDGFEPENESTPLHLSKPTSHPQPSSPNTASSRKRKRGQHDIQPTSSTPLSSPLASPSLPSSPMKHSEADPLEPDKFDSETNAPPLSSSSVASLSPQPTTRHQPSASTANTRGNNTKRRRRATQVSTLFLETFMPRSRRIQRNARNNHQEVYHDESSTSLLNDMTLDLPISDTESNIEDPQPEQLHVDVEPTPPKRTRSRRGLKSALPVPTVIPAPTPAPKNANKKAQKNPPPPRKALAAKPASQHRRTPTTTTTMAPSPVPKRKYGRRRTQTADNKENQVQDHGVDESYLPGGEAEEDDDGGDGRGLQPVALDDGTGVDHRQTSKQLVRMKHKFAEIDAWEMEFETVDMGDTSSPWR